MKDDIPVSYIVFCNCKNRLVEKANSKDIYTIFLWTYPQYRNKGFASQMSYELLNGIGLDYRNAYKTIAKDNLPSIKVAEKNNYVCIANGYKTKLFHHIRFASKESGILIYEFEKVN